MVAIPTDTPVTTPRLETVATDGAEEIQALDTAAVPFPVRVKTLPTQRVVFPVMVGFAYTDTKAVTWQPLLFVYVIVVFPAVTAVTNPLAEIVATPVLLEIQGVLVAADALPVN